MPTTLDRVCVEPKRRHHHKIARYDRILAVLASRVAQPDLGLEFRAAGLHDLSDSSCAWLVQFPVVTVGAWRGSRRRNDP